MTNDSKIIDINTISKLLPHAYPFLLIDKIIEMDEDNYGIGIKNVTINEPFFQGHFPGNPIMPGVLQIEGMAQTAAVICMLANNINEDSGTFGKTSVCDDMGARHSLPDSECSQRL